VLCARQTHPSKSISNIKFRTLEEIIKQLDEYPNLKYITLAGPTSEPTLYPYLFELIEYIQSRDIEISLFINGDTHNNMYYKKLGLLFNKGKGKIYFTICGSTQELHEKYRRGSSLNNVLNNLESAYKYTKKVVLTWIIFKYNYQDYQDNKHKYNKYNMEVFNTLPVKEHYDLDTGDICLNNTYDINKEDFENIICPSITNRFHLIFSDGEVFNCSLHKMFGDTHCFECSEKNSLILKNNKIYKLAESESETSEEELRYC
jgi:hypothetical protein